MNRTSNIETRTCIDCERELPETAFGFRSVRGKVYRESACTSCKANRSRKWREAQKGD